MKMVYEDIPTVLLREGDSVINGRNNSLILLGRDRIDTKDSGFGDEKNAGSIHLTVGRKSENISIKDDSATVYLSMKSNPDETLGLRKANEVGSVIFLRSDHVVINPRESFRIDVGDISFIIKNNKLTIFGDVSFGEEAVERILKESFLNWARSHTHPDPATGFTGIPVQPIPNTVLSSNVRSK